MTPFTHDQWIMLGLVFVLGLVFGMLLMSGGRGRMIHRAEIRRLEHENKRLRDELRDANARAAKNGRTGIF